MQPADSVELSVVISCHYEEKSIDEFHRRLSETMAKIGRPYEIIYVNDGSKDATWDKLKAIYAADPKVHALVNLFRNSGQLAAITAAMAEARGSALVWMDSDLQLMPEELPLLLKEYDRGYDLVTGYRVNRKDSKFRTVPSLLANIIMRRASRSNIRDFGCTFKIYNAKLVRAFEYGPFHVFSNVDTISRIDRICEVPVTHHPRRYGESGWTFAKLYRYNMDNVVTISERPFQISGLLCLAGAVLFLCRLLLEAVAPLRVLPAVSNGLLLNAVVISMLLNVAMLSLAGEFAIRTFFVARRLPSYIVKETLRRDP